ncbi:acetate--CoA ligase family protein [Pseudomonas lini]
MEAAVGATLEDPAVGSLCINLATTGVSGSLAAAQVLARIAASASKPILVFFLSPPSVQIAEALRVFADAGIPVLPSPSRAAKAIAMLMRFKRTQSRILQMQEDEGLKVERASVPLSTAVGSRSSLSEVESKEMLRSIGIPVTTDLIVKGFDAALFDKVKAPLVVKIVSADIAHKNRNRRRKGRHSDRPGA